MEKYYRLIFLFLIPHLLFSGGKQDKKALETKNNNVPIIVQNQNAYFTGDGAKDTNYEKETCAIFFFIRFQENRIISEIENGLNKTNKRYEWGFDNWPKIASSIGGKTSMLGNHISYLNFTITTNIKNEQGNIIFSTTEKFVAHVECRI